MIRKLAMGCQGPDVREVQKALNYRMNAGLNPDGDFGNLTRNAVVAFQKRYALGVDGIVGSQTRSVLFPLVGITFHGVAMYGQEDYAVGSRSKSTRTGPLLAMAGDGVVTGDEPVIPNLAPINDLIRTLPSDPTQGPLDQFKPPALNFSLPIPPLLTAPLLNIPGMKLDSRQVQPGASFNTLPMWQNKTGSANPSLAAIIAVQAVLARNKDEPGHLEVAEGFQLAAPFFARTDDGRDVTLQWFAQATWADPFWQRGRWHLVQPFAQISATVDLKQGNMTLGAGVFPVNISYEFIKDKLSVFGQGGIVAGWDLSARRIEIGGQVIGGANISFGGL